MVIGWRSGVETVIAGSRHSGLLVGWGGELRAIHLVVRPSGSAVIVVAMATIGTLEGILVGIVAACVFFVVRYGRIDAIRRRSTLADRRSVAAGTADRAASIQRSLTEALC